MTKRRQDAWAKDEDVILAETVLRYVREGKTQIEAFTEAGEILSRTPAACGFRWNATVRKQYEAAFKLAKQNEQYDIVPKEHERYLGSHPIEKAISLLESIKQSDQGNLNKKYLDQINILTRANEELKEQLTRYQEVFIEIKNLCEWLDNENQIKINNMKNENVQNV